MSSKFEVIEGCLHSGGFPGAFLGAERVEIKPETLKRYEGATAVLGVPFDGMTITRTGATLGPKAMREASEQMSVYNSSLGIDLSKHTNIIDCGDVLVVPGAVEKTFNLLEEKLDLLYKHNIRPIMLGGDHSTTIPAVRAFSKNHNRPGLILVDSHYDTAENLGGVNLSTCCPISRAVDAGFDPRNIVLIGMNGWMNPKAEEQYAVDKGITVIHIEEVIEKGIHEAAQKAISVASEGTDGVYMTFDIDSVDAGQAPGTGVPAIGGLTSREAIQLVRQIGKVDGGLKGFDIMEVSPPYDRDGITARLGVVLALEALASSVT